MRSAGTAEIAVPARTAAQPLRVPLTARLADYLELTKPRIALLALLTVSIGFALGSAGNPDAGLLAHALIGIALVAASSSTLNQVFERRTDARMTRTASRPLPAGRLLTAEALLFGLATGLLGCVWLAVFVNVLTALLSFATLILYAAVYTPLKRRTSLCTAVGAIPGALPPVLGYAAASGTVDRNAFAVFAIMFLWQFPHFLAIAWLYREQYARAGLRMLPAVLPCRGVTGLLSTVYALVLLPVSLLPSQFGIAGNGYFWTAAVLGVGYLACAVLFLRHEAPPTARRLLWSSLVYLPLVLTALVWDHFRLLN